MATTNLADVTATLKKLVDTGLQQQSVTDAYQVSAASPDATFGVTTVSVHLFHVIESPEFKNLPPKFGTGPVPVRLAPMGLILQYVISVITQATEDAALDEAALRQAQFIGYIARTIHDYPVITPNTTITLATAPPITILQGTLLDHKATIDFIIRPAPKEETVSFWSTEDTHVPRLTLFVEARVAVLDAPPPPFAPGIVLSVGQFVFPSSEPQLLTTTNDIWFEPPARPASKVTASPARAALFDEPGSAALDELVPPALPVDDPRRNILKNNVVRIDAVGLAPGDRSLLLRSQAKNFSATLDLDQATQPAQNQNWNLAATPTSVTFSIFRDVFDTASNTPKTVVPGIYGVRVIVNDPRQGDPPRPRSSNEIAFAITPQILSAVPAGAARTYTLRVVGVYLNSTLDIQLSVGGVALTLVTTGTPTDGQFLVGTTDTDTITFVLRATDPVTGQAIPPPSDDNPLPIRLVVNGATATPRWLTVPA